MPKDFKPHSRSAVVRSADIQGDTQVFNPLPVKHETLNEFIPTNPSSNPVGPTNPTVLSPSSEDSDSARPVSLKRFEYVPETTRLEHINQIKKFADHDIRSGNITGNSIFIGGSTTRGLRSVSGQYGTVQTTGGGAGNHEGYSIDGRYVFMSVDQNSCGIFNDISNQWMIFCHNNGALKLHHAGNEKLDTTSTGINVTGGITASGNIIYYYIPHSSDSST